MTERGESMTPAETSSPRCAGRQCMKMASRLASDMTRSSTIHPSKSLRRFFGKISDRFVRERARHDPLDIPRQHLRRIVNRLSSANLNVARGEEQRVTAELEHACFKRDARARRRFLEDHRQRLSFQRVA